MTVKADQIARVQTPTATYPVLCGGDAPTVVAALWRDRWRQAAIIGDNNTLALFGERLAVALGDRCDLLVKLSFPAGEAHKTRATKEALEDQLLEAGLDRSSCCIVAVGGGIALDVAGFVAATYLRGVPHINVATSLLAQVDAAVGGKTGVNTRFGKNLIGAFQQPHAVVIDVAALRSLDRDELRFGLAEAIKHAVIADRDLFDQLDGWAAETSDLIPPPSLVARCVQIKAEVVTRDEREQAYRQVLNYGHTVAHALESASNHAIQHGAAVAVGMVVEARLAERLCGFSPRERRQLEQLLARLGLPVKPPMPFAAARAYFSHDKKTRAGVVHCALPQRIGAMHDNEGRWVLPVAIDQLAEAWQAAMGQEEAPCSA